MISVDEKLMEKIMRSNTNEHLSIVVFKRIGWLFLLLCAVALPTLAQTTAFTYQGRLTDASATANGTYDFQFALYDALTGGTQQGTSQTVSGVPVSQGVFTVKLDFGAAAFPGADRYLEIRVKKPSDTTYTTLAPRQQVTSAPYAITAANSNKLGGVDASQFVTGQVVRTVNGLNGDVTFAAGSNVTITPSGDTLTIASTGGGASGSYIQNQTTQQTGANFNIDGTGKANIFDATTQYNIGGNRVLSSPSGTSSLFAGFNAGGTNTGAFNSFFGTNAGANNSTAGGNSFFGNQAGFTNTTGQANTFVGNLAGFANIGGDGSHPNDGSFNSFVGNNAGRNNSTGVGNSFFGYQAGFGNSTGNYNNFFGYHSGLNTTGASNSFFGTRTGEANTTGASNSFFGNGAGLNNDIGNHNSFFGYSAGMENTAGAENSFFGYEAGFNNTTGYNNTFIGIGAGNINDATQVHDSTAIGVGSQVSTNYTIVLGQDLNTTQIPGKFTVGNLSPTRGQMNLLAPAGNANFYMQGASGTRGINFGVDSSAANAKLFISQYDGTSYQDRLIITPSGTVQITTLGAAGATQLCLNASNEISSCSSSFRYKTNIAPFSSGLNLVNKLQPITFNWKADNKSDLGLGAEDVAKVEPLLVTHNAQGEVEGVKYDRVAVVLLNAVKEQQTQIEAQQKQLQQQQFLIDALKKIVCPQNPQADVCKEVK